MIASVEAAKIRDYIDGVLSGTLVASSLVRAACQRHVNDLAKVGTEGFDYYFDERHAIRVVQFFPHLLRHSIGKFAGLPFDLEPWQAFQVACVFGWKKTSDDTRRFRKWYCSVGRKNGKSTLAAGIAFFMAMADVNPRLSVPEPVAQVVLTATKRDQVIQVVYGEMVRMRNSSPAIVKCSRNVNQQFLFAHNSGQVICIGSDRPFDGLNPTLTVSDELHAWTEQHRPLYDTMTTGGASREQPMHFITTTAGDDKSQIWLEEYNYCASICKGDIVDETVFVYCAELDPGDDPFDEANWLKSNPNLGISVSLDYLREQANEQSRTAIGINKFTRYHGNRLVTSTEKAFDLEKWDLCQGILSNWEEAEAVGAGVDLGGRDDLAAEALVARFLIGGSDEKPIYRYEIKVQSYIGDDSERDLQQMPFVQWIHDGYIQRTKYPTADLRDSLVEKCFSSGCSTVAYDPYNAQTLSEELSREGLQVLRMPQNHAMFNEPIRDFLQAIRDGRVTHDGNKMLRWCAGNAVVYRDRKDNWMFDKKASADKIDPIVAVVMAFRVCCLAPARYTGKLYIV